VHVQEVHELNVRHGVNNKGNRWLAVGAAALCRPVTRPKVQRPAPMLAVYYDRLVKALGGELTAVWWVGHQCRAHDVQRRHPFGPCDSILAETEALKRDKHSGQVSFPNL
jgi:hypothetical protein